MQVFYPDSGNYQYDSTGGIECQAENGSGGDGSHHKYYGQIRTDSRGDAQVARANS